MFGYIAPRLDQLPEETQNRYRSFYCGLCKSIGRISGRSGRILLSHDMTFLAILLNSLMEPGEATEQIRCAAHPVRPREILRGEAIEYAAAMNVLLMDLKCEDQVRDDGSKLGSMERRMLKKSVDALRDQYQTQYQGIMSSLNALWEEEKAAKPNPDRLCNLSGEMLGAAFVPDWADSFWQPALRGLGQSLGRFVYWMDAWEDLADDQKKGHVNPLTKWTESESDLSSHEEPGEENPSPKEAEPSSAALEAFVRDVLEMMMGEATEYFEALPLEKDLDLLRNVLYSGVWQRYEAKQQRAARKERKKT